MPKRATGQIRLTFLKLILSRALLFCS